MHLGLNHLINYFNSLIKNASLIEYLSGLGLSEVLHIFSLFPSIQDNSLNLIIHAKYRVNQKEWGFNDDLYLKLCKFYDAKVEFSFYALINLLQIKNKYRHKQDFREWKKNSVQSVFVEMSHFYG